MNNKTCGDCKYHNSEQNICINVKGYKMHACKCSGACHDFTKASVFDTITTSPKVLAKKLVYRKYYILRSATWASTVLTSEFETKAEAISATVKKLKEVCYE